MAQVSEQLINDHAALDGVLKNLQTALRSGDLEGAHASLDLFWARLAVHIRAEHLLLFPTVIRSLENAVGVPTPTLEEAQTCIAELRLDHNFFMHELARAVDILRSLTTVSEQSTIRVGLNNVNDIVLEVERRLSEHNEKEETQIYQWVTMLLNFEEHANLGNQITNELHKHPSRFTLSTWLDE